jgi:hypothetical protein
MPLNFVYDGREKGAWVTHRLTASPLYNNSEFRALVVCIGTHQSYLDSGDPFTYSPASLAMMACISEKTACRCVKRFVRDGIFKFYAWKTHTRKKYAVYVFDYTKLETMIKTRDNLSPVERIYD